MAALLIINGLTLTLIAVSFHYHRVQVSAMQRRIDVRNAHHREFHADCLDQFWSGDSHCARIHVLVAAHPSYEDTRAQSAWV